MLVPKAPVHEDHLVQAWEDKIRRSRQIAAMQAVSVAQTVREAADEYFRFRVRLSDTAHAGT